MGSTLYFWVFENLLSKCVLQLQLEWCNEKTHKIMIVEPLSALMKTYQILKNMRLQNVIAFFCQKMKTKLLLTLCEFFLSQKGDKDESSLIQPCLIQLEKQDTHLIQ